MDILKCHGKYSVYMQISIFQVRIAFIRFYDPKILKDYYKAFFGKSSLTVSAITVLITTK